MRALVREAFERVRPGARRDRAAARRRRAAAGAGRGDRAADRGAQGGAAAPRLRRRRSHPRRRSPSAASCSRTIRPARAGRENDTAPHLKTALPGPKAQAIIERDAQVVSPSYTRDYPLVMARGEGAFVEDVDGNVFLDCTAGIAVTATGHSHPDVVAGDRRAGAASSCTCRAPTSTTSRRCGSARSCRRSRRCPGRIGRSSATPAPRPIEAALKLARYYTKRHNIIAFLGAFHGRTMGSLSLTASKPTQRRGFGPLVPGVYHAPYANCYRCPGRR